MGFGNGLSGLTISGEMSHSIRQQFSYTRFEALSIDITLVLLLLSTLPVRHWRVFTKVTAYARSLGASVPIAKGT